MTSKAALFALFAMWGVGTCTLPAMAEDEVPSSDREEEVTGSETAFTDKVWVRAESDGLPGPMQVFLSNGTLVTDSCWETYRLSDWKMVDEHNLLWSEDGTDIGAEILSVSASELVLRLGIEGGTEQRFVAADVPHLCPDMPR